MTDDDEITFGRYNGTKIGKVPASYLLWLWNNGMWMANSRSQREDPVRIYIVKNFNALETECPDIIIDHRP
jgi:Putative quorum-sensing-regulated virulence factor